MHFQTFLVLGLEVVDFAIESVLVGLFFLEQFQAFDVLKLQSGDLILGLGNIEASLVHHVLELNGNFGVVEIGVSFFDVGPIIVRMRQWHRRFERVSV